MQFEKYTIKSQELIQKAQNIAQASDHQSIENGHLLKSLIEVDENIFPFILKKQGINPNNISLALDRMIQSYPRVSGGKLYISQDANKTLVNAEKVSDEMGDQYNNILLVSERIQFNHLF